MLQKHHFEVSIGEKQRRPLSCKREGCFCNVLLAGEKGAMVSLCVRAVGFLMLDVLDPHWEAQILMKRRKGEGRCQGRFEHAEACQGWIPVLQL